MTGDDTVRLTYAELAAARGVSLDSAKRLVLRRGWMRQRGNDGLTRILVPLSSLPACVVPDVGDDIGDDRGGDDSLTVGLTTKGKSSKSVPLLNGHYSPATIPIDSLTDRPDVGPDIGLTTATAAIEVLKSSVTSLQEQLAVANQRADTAERPHDGCGTVRRI